MTDTKTELKEFDTFENQNLDGFKEMASELPGFVPDGVLSAASNSIAEIRPEVASGHLSAEQGEEAVQERFAEKVEALDDDGDADVDEDDC